MSLGLSLLVACASAGQAPRAAVRTDTKQTPAPPAAPTAPVDVRPAPSAVEAAVAPSTPPERALRDAREHARALARADWSHVPGEAGKVVGDLASVVASYGGDAREHEELAFQSKRLAETKGSGFDQVRWIKHALDTALGALEAHGGDGPAIDDARQAIANIDAGQSVAFERAPIQDAIRATLDAFSFAHRGCGAQQTAGRTP